MKKLPKQFSVYARTKKEANYICEKQKEICGGALNTPEKDMFYRFSPNQTWDKWGYSSTTYINNLPEYNIQHEFTFEEFKSYFEEEFVLPEMWYIKDCEEVAKWASKVFDCGSFVGDKYLHVDQKLYPKTGCYTFYNKMEGYTEITLEQFKKYVLKEVNMEKEIIGYKLIKPEFEKAASEIVGDKVGCINFIRCREYQNHIIPTRNFDTNLRILKESGVLDLWFEPVYKDEKQDIVLTLSNGKQVTVTKEGKIMAEGREVNIVDLLKSYSYMFKPTNIISGWEVRANTISIGCWDNITQEDLQLIINTQEKQSN